MALLTQSLAAIRGSPRARRLLLASAALGSVYAGARVLARQLMLALMYHPFRYEDDPEYWRLRQMAIEAFRQLGYCIQDIEYDLWRGGVAKPQRALLIHPANGVQPLAGLWAVFGGNAMVSVDWFQFCHDLLYELPKDAAKPAFLLIDYPGYGANRGAASPENVLAASLAAVRSSLQHLVKPPAQLHLLGHSIGAAAASQLAVAWAASGSFHDTASISEVKSDGQSHTLQPGRLVLSAPFFSIETMAQTMFRLITNFRHSPPTWLLRHFIPHHWDNMVWVPSAARAGWALSIILGSHDEIVPPYMGKALRDSVKSGGHSCAFVEVNGAGHNDLIMSARHAITSLMGIPLRDGLGSKF